MSKPTLTNLLDTAAVALAHFGASAQELKYYEEAAELTCAMRHGESRHAIRGEAADVLIMAAQMLLSACDEPGQAEQMIQWKLESLRARLRESIPLGGA